MTRLLSWFDDHSGALQVVELLFLAFIALWHVVLQRSAAKTNQRIALRTLGYIAEALHGRVNSLTPGPPVEDYLLRGLRPWLPTDVAELEQAGRAVHDLDYGFVASASFHLLALEPLVWAALNKHPDLQDPQRYEEARLDWERHAAGAGKALLDIMERCPDQAKRIMR